MNGNDRRHIAMASNYTEIVKIYERSNKKCNGFVNDDNYPSDTSLISIAMSRTTDKET